MLLCCGQESGAAPDTLTTVVLPLHLKAVKWGAQQQPQIVIYAVVGQKFCRYH